MANALGQPLGSPDTLVLPQLRSSPQTEHAVRRALGRPTGLSVRTVSAVGVWAELVGCAGVGLLDVAMLGQEEVDQALRQLRSLGIEAPCIVGVAATAEVAVERREEIEKWELTTVVLSSEGAALGYSVARAWITSIGVQLRSLLGEAQVRPSEVSGALRRLTREVIPGPDSVGERPPLRRIEDLAAEMNTSRAQFHRARRAAQLDMRGLAEAWVGMQVVCIKAIENPAMDALAARVGYRSRAGLTALGERALGISVGEWRDTPLSEIIAICIPAWSEALRNASPAMDTADRSKIKRRGATS